MILFINPLSALFCQTSQIWTDCTPPVLIDSLTAIQINDYENSPESIVAYFYASQIRKDNKWDEVITPMQKRSDVLIEKLNAYVEWNFKKVRLISKCEYSPGQMWIRIFMEVGFNGQIESGEDDVSLTKVDGRWVIASVPT
nr:hypothetical protein [Bacteroidota bacterium]